MCAEIFFFLQDTILCHLSTKEKGLKLLHHNTEQEDTEFPFMLPPCPVSPSEGGAENFLSHWSWGTCQGSHSIGSGNEEVGFKLSLYRGSQRLKNIWVFDKKVKFTLSCYPKKEIIEPFELERTF